MAEIELGLALYGLYRYTAYFKSTCLRLIIDRSCFSFSWSTYDICVIQERVRIEPWALTRPAKIKADACSIGGNTLHVCSYSSYVRKATYVCSRVNVFARSVCDCVHLAWYRISWLQIPEHIHAPVSCLPGIMLVSVQAPRATSHSCFVWHFVCLVFLLCFLPCLSWPRLKTIRYHDLTFSQKTSPLLFFVFFGFYSVDIVFALLLLCYIKCCKFVLVLQSSSPALCWMCCS